MDAHKVFDAMSTHLEVTMSSVIHVSVSHIVYPVTEAVLRKVFELYGCGVVRMVVFQGNSSVEASVQMSSGHEAVHARNALHGRNIYDGCCNISIECTPLPSSHNASTLPTAPFLSMVPNVTLATSPTTAASMSATATEDTPAAAGYMSSTETASAGTQKVFAQMSTSPRGSSSVKDKGQQHHVAEVFDTRLEEAGSWTKPSRIIKWISRVRISRRPVRWNPRSKCRHSSLSLPPPRPPEQSYSGQETASTPLPWPSFQFVTLLWSNRELMLLDIPPWCRSAYSPGSITQQHSFSYALQLFGHNEPVSKTVGCDQSRNWYYLQSCDLSGVNYGQSRVELACGICYRECPWQRNAFSPSDRILVFITEKGVFLSQLLIQGSLKKVPIFSNSAMFFVTSKMETNLNCLSIILARFDTCSVKWLVLHKCILDAAKHVVGLLLNLTLGDVVCMIQKRFRLAVHVADIIQKLYPSSHIKILEESLSMVAAEYKADNKFSFGVNSQCAVQICGFFMLRCSIVFLLECTNQHTGQVMKILASLCLLEVLPTYGSGYTFQVDFSLDNAATATAKQLFSWVILHYQIMHGNLITLELKVKAYMQMYWHRHPGVPQSIPCGTSKKKSELTCNRIPTTEIFVFRLELLWDPGGWQVTLVHSFGTLKLIASACSVMDIMPPWRRGGFSPGAHVCTCLIKEMELSEVMQWMTGNARSRTIKISLLDELIGIDGQFYLTDSLGCYFHIQYRLFGFNIPQLCGVPTLDGVAWDPGGCFTVLLGGACCLTFGIS